MNFQKAWLNEFKGGWLKQGSTSKKAYCIPCAVELNAKHDIVKKHSTRETHISKFKAWNKLPKMPETFAKINDQTDKKLWPNLK